MEERPASRAARGRVSRQRSASPCSPMETPWQQVALQWCWMDSCRDWSRALGIGSANRLRCRPGATRHAHFHRSLRHQPQPDVCRVDLTLSRRRACHAKRLDVRIAPSRGMGHPPGRSSRRAQAGANFRGSVPPVQEAGSSIPLAAGAERQDVCVVRWNYLEAGRCVTLGNSPPLHPFYGLSVFIGESPATRDSRSAIEGGAEVTSKTPDERREPVRVPGPHSRKPRTDEREDYRR